MPNQKGIAPILIVVLIALVVGGYFVYTKNKANSPVSYQRESTGSASSGTPSADTSTRVTFKNNSCKFSFKYPSNWTVLGKTDEVLSNTKMPNAPRDVAFCMVSLKNPDYTGVIKNAPTLSITNVPNPQGKTLKDFQLDDMKVYGSGSKTITLKIAGTDFPFYDVENVGMRGYLSHGNDIFIVLGVYNKDDTKSKDQLEKVIQSLTFD